MKVKAKISFAGPEISMAAGEEREFSKSSELSELLEIGYVESMETDESMETAESMETKKTTRGKAVKNEDTGVNK